MDDEGYDALYCRGLTERFTEKTQKMVDSSLHMNKYKRYTSG